jgi:acetyl esterase/lipase
MTPSLGTFNALTPHDRGGRRIAAGARYGDGARHLLDVYAPRKAGQAPVIMFFYGGSWAGGDRRSFSFVGDAFASQGFLTIIPDYRLYPEVQFPDFLNDCAAATRWARDNAANFGGDPTRLVLMGHSAGAYNAMMLALDTRYLHGAGADPTTVRGVAGLSGPYDFFPFDVPATRNTFGQAPDPAATQPVTFVRGDAPSAFMAWGEKDNLVGRRNIDNLARALRARGAAPTVKLYDSLGHAGMLLAISLALRGRTSLFTDLVNFARAATL